MPPATAPARLPRPVDGSVLGRPAPPDGRTSRKSFSWPAEGRVATPVPGRVPAPVPRVRRRRRAGTRTRPSAVLGRVAAPAPGRVPVLGRDPAIGCDTRGGVALGREVLGRDGLGRETLGDDGRGDGRLTAGDREAEGRETLPPPARPAAATSGATTTATSASTTPAGQKLASRGEHNYRRN